jgi:signal transduction histidine kinase
MGRSDSRAASAAGAVALLLSVWSSPGLSAEDTEPLNRRFLAIYEHDATLAANVEVAAGIERVLSHALPYGRQMYSEHLDLTRFSAPDQVRPQIEALAAKYRDEPMDVVIAGGDGALGFMLEHREAFAPDTPIVFGGVNAGYIENLDLPADVYGVASSFDARRTLELARKVQPNATALVLFSGSAEIDREWLAIARRGLGAVEGLDVSVVSDRTIAEFRELARGLDLDTILLVVTVFEDSEGRKFLPRDSVAVISEAARTPIYTVFNTQIGHGALGGHVETFGSIGEAMGHLALRVVKEDPDTPPLVRTTGHPVVDWRQLRRFGLDRNRLPSATELLYYDPTAWESYRAEILLASTVIFLQSATIGALVVQSRRRRKVEGELAEGRLELAHLSRTTQLGELSGALAHELNQPLTAILANAEAGRRLIEQDKPDLEEVAAILADISADDRRAAGIISELRRLMVKGEVTMAPVDLAAIVDNTLALTRSELVTRQTQVEVLHEARDLTVMASAAQLQQVVLNLVLNGTEAMAETPPAERLLTVETRLRPDGWRELSVRDRGRGVTAEMRDKAFRPFVSSKPGGLGFGLSICRSIAQAHGGRLDFDPGVRDGARMVLTLPAP